MKLAPRALVMLSLAALVAGLVVVLRSGGETGVDRGVLPGEAGQRGAHEATGLDESSVDDGGPSGAEDRRIDVAAIEGVRIQGRVVDARGIVVRNASLRLWPVRGGSLPLDLAAFGALDVVEVAVSKAGSFSVEVEAPRDYQLWASAPERLSSEVATVAIRLDEPVVELDLVLPDGLAIKGRVLDESHQPVENADVCAFADVERFGGELAAGVRSVEYYGRPQARSREDGTFWLYPVRSTDVRYVVLASRQRTSLDSSVSTTIALPRRGAFVHNRVTEVISQVEVVAGTSDLELVYRESTSGRSTVRIGLSANAGGGLPERLTYELRHTGPHGGVFFETSGSSPVDEFGVARIRGLSTGARYELDLTLSEHGWTRHYGSFRALSGEYTLDVEVPGLFPATFTIRDPETRLGEDAELRARFLDESFVLRTVVSARGPNEAEPVLRLRAGRHEVQVLQDWRVLARFEIEMPSHAETFVLDVP